MDNLYPDFFGFSEHRALLAYIYQQKRKQNPRFSYRAFSRTAGYVSPSVLKDAINGRKSVPLKSLGKFLRPFNLTKRQQDYFNLLAHHDLARKEDERMHLFRELIRFRRASQARQIEAGQYEFYRKWYYGAIRELAGLKDFKPDPAWIADRLEPRITPEQASKALGLLLEWGFLKQDSAGNIIQAEPLLSIDDKAPIPDLKKLVHQMIELEWSAVEKFGPEDRQRLGLVMHMSRACYDRIRQKLLEIQKDILNDVGGCTDEADMVCLLGLSLFPLIRKGGRSE